VNIRFYVHALIMLGYATLFLYFSLISCVFFQFHFKQNQRKQERKNKMDQNDDSRLVTHTDDESRLIPKSWKTPRAVTDIEDAVQVGPLIYQFAG
jgi:hypothetical protein